VFITNEMVLFYGLGVEREFHIIFPKVLDDTHVRELNEKYNIEAKAGTYLNLIVFRSKEKKVSNKIYPKKFPKSRAYDTYIEVVVLDPGKVLTSTYLVDIPNEILSYVDKYEVGGSINRVLRLHTGQRKKNVNTVLTEIYKTCTELPDIEFDGDSSLMYEARTFNFKKASVKDIMKEIKSNMQVILENVKLDKAIIALSKSLGEPFIDDTCCSQRYSTVLFSSNTISIMPIRNWRSYDQTGYQGSTHIWTTLNYNDKLHAQRNVQQRKKQLQAKIEWSQRTSVFARYIQWVEPYLLYKTIGKMESTRHNRDVSALGTLNPDILDMSKPGKMKKKVVFDPSVETGSKLPPITYYEIKKPALNQRSFNGIPMDIRIPSTYNQYVNSDWTGFECRFLNNMTIQHLEWVLQIFEKLAKLPVSQNLGIAGKSKRWQEISNNVINGLGMTDAEEKWILSKVGLLT
jgi:hypothetical protein